MFLSPVCQWAGFNNWPLRDPASQVVKQSEQISSSVVIKVVALLNEQKVICFGFYHNTLSWVDFSRYKLFFVMSWVEFCEIRKIWQQLIYLEVSTLVQGCGQALIYRLHHQYQDHHFVFHMMICWAFPNNKKKLYPENIFCNGEDWFEFELAQIQFNFIPGQRAKLQLVGQSIQCSECELHIQRKWKYKQIIKIFIKRLWYLKTDYQNIMIFINRSWKYL